MTRLKYFSIILAALSLYSSGVQAMIRDKEIVLCTAVEPLDNGKYILPNGKSYQFAWIDDLDLTTKDAGSGTDLAKNSLSLTTNISIKEYRKTSMAVVRRKKSPIGLVKKINLTFINNNQDEALVEVVPDKSGNQRFFTRMEISAYQKSVYILASCTRHALKDDAGYIDKLKAATVGQTMELNLPHIMGSSHDEKDNE